MVNTNLNDKRKSAQNSIPTVSPTSKVLDQSKAPLSQPEVTLSEPQLAHIAQESTQTTTNQHSNPNSYPGSSTYYPEGKTDNKKNQPSLPSAVVTTNKRHSAKKSLDLTDDFLETLHPEQTRPTVVKWDTNQPYKPRPHSELNLNSNGKESSSQPRQIGPGTPHRVGLSGEPTTSTSSASSGNLNQRRNSDFHVLFPSLPIDEILIADHGCALQKGTLVQGRIYLTQKTLSFYSSFFGWTNKITLPLTEIICIEKRHVAYVIPSAIQVSTLHHKYLFTSFRNRDAVLIQLNSLWQEARPLTKTVESDPSGSMAGDSDESEYEEVNYTDKLDPNLQPEQPPDSPLHPPTDLPTSPVTLVNEPQFPPATHCRCDKSEHHDLSLEAQFQVPPTTIYDYLYQDLDGWFTAFLNSGQSNAVINPWEDSSRKISYVKPLDNPLGPKSTRCIITQSIKYSGLPETLTVEDSVESLDVPSGSSFRALYRVCLTQNGLGGTRILVTGGIIWLKSSWLKGAIERGVMDGHTQYFNDLTASLENHLKSKTVSDPTESTQSPLLTQSPQVLSRRRRVRRVPSHATTPTLTRRVLAMILTSSSALWGCLLAGWQRGWDCHENLSTLAGNLSLVGLGLALSTAIFVNWRHASHLATQLDHLRAHSSPPYDQLPATLDGAVHDILHFATSLRRYVDTLDQHIGRIHPASPSPPDKPSPPSPPLVKPPTTAEVAAPPSQ